MTYVFRRPYQYAIRHSLKGWIPSVPAAAATYSLALEAGSFTVAGQTASLLVGRVCAPAAGAYTISGQAVALRAARTIPLAAGAYTVAGQASAL